MHQNRQIIYISDHFIAEECIEPTKRITIVVSVITHEIHSIIGTATRYRMDCPGFEVR